MSIAEQTIFIAFPVIARIFVFLQQNNTNNIEHTNTK